MGKAFKITLVVMLVLGFFSAAEAQVKFRGFTALTGGGTGALDKIPVAELTNGDIGFVATSSYFYVYVFDSTGTDAESSPQHIRPDDYSTGGVWDLIGLYGVQVQSGPSATPALNFYDSDATDNDLSARIYVNCTDAGSGSEDCDMYFQVQVAGSDATATTKIQIDADGNIIFSDDVIINEDLKLYFRDSAIYINSGADGYLDLEADTQIRINAPMDMMDEDITSIDKLEGVDSAVYIDMGTDGYIDLEADTGIRFNGPVLFANEGALALPTTTSGDQALSAGQIGIKTDEDAIAVHGGAAGEVQDEISLIQHVVMVFDPSWAYDQSATYRTLPIAYLGDDFPHGLTLTEWRLRYVSGDPTTELDADLMCDTTPDFNPAAGGTVMDVLDTTNGASGADSGFDSATCANGSNMYVRFGADPTDANVMVVLDIWFFANED